MRVHFNTCALYHHCCALSQKGADFVVENRLASVAHHLSIWDVAHVALQPLTRGVQHELS